MLAHEILDLKNTPPISKFRYLSLYHSVKISFDVIIPIGRVGLCKTSKRHEPPRNPIGIGPLENLSLKFIYRFIYVYYVLVNIIL